MKTRRSSKPTLPAAILPVLAPMQVPAAVSAGPVDPAADQEEQAAPARAPTTEEGATGLDAATVTARPAAIRKARTVKFGPHSVALTLSGRGMATDWGARAFNHGMLPSERISLAEAHKAVTSDGAVGGTILGQCGGG